MNEFIEIPNALPVLTRGNHKPGSGKACIMDAISIITGKPQEQDHPTCVHPMLRPLFITVNDSIADEHRHRLWEPGLRAIGTAEPGQSNHDQSELAWGIVFGAARRRLFGERVADHVPGVRLLHAVLDYRAHGPSYARRRALATGGYTASRCCRGCELIVELATTTRANRRVNYTTVITGPLHQQDVDGTFDALNAALDDFLVMLPTPADAVPDDIDWEQLRTELGVVEVVAG